MQIKIISIILILYALSGLYDVRINSESKICTKTISYAVTVTKLQPFQKQVTARRWNGQRYIKLVNETRVVTQIEWRTKSIDTCCEGYTRYRLKCIPLCDEVCENSKCTAPNVCTCNEGYVKFTNFRCLPHCENCKFGSCVAPNYCECFSNYEKDINGTCQPKCINECVNGYCAHPNFCMCFEGYKVSASALHICEPICTPACKNGKCIRPSECECFEGYKKNNEGECVSNCENCENGYCIAPNQCVCHEGYEKIGNYCKPICEPNCINGNCFKPNQCACDSGYEIKDGSNHFCQPVCSGCSSGNCVSPEVCQCHENFEWDDHTFMCIPSTTENYPEELNVFETSTSISTNCEGFGCSRDCYGDVTHDCISSCNINCKNGKCNDNKECFCDEGYILNGTECVATNSSGCINGFYIEQDFCECFEGYILDNNETYQNRCIPLCDNEEDGCINGTCIKPNVCECKSGFKLSNENKFTCIEIQGDLDADTEQHEKNISRAKTLFNWWILLIFVILILSLSTMFLYTYIKVFKKKEYDINKREQFSGVHFSRKNNSEKTDTKTAVI